MIGLLYNSFYIEKYFPWAVQKYKDKNGDSATSLYGIPVNEASKNFLWGCFHTIEGPVYSNSMCQYKECYVIKGPAFDGAIIPAEFFEHVENDSATVIDYKEEPTKEEKKSHKVAVRKSTKEKKIYPLITKNFINIADLKWWSINEKIPPVGLPITLCVKERPSTSNCSPYKTFPAKYCYDSTSGKYIFIGMRGENYWYLTENDFRWTVDAGRCPDF